MVLATRERNLQVPLHVAFLHGRERAREMLITALPECLHARSYDRRSFIHYAAVRGDLSLLSRFLQMWPEGAQCRDRMRATPLHTACEYIRDEEQIVATLLRVWPEGARCQDLHGRTPLHLAVTPNADFAVVEMLLRAWPEGAQCADDTGSTPRDLAIRDDASAELIQLLDETQLPRSTDGSCE